MYYLCDLVDIKECILNDQELTSEQKEIIKSLIEEKEGECVNG